MKGLARVPVSVLFGALFLFAAAAEAQQLSLNGIVRDSTGVIPGATVVLSSGGNQISTTTSDGAGAYGFTGLAEGGYEIAVSRPGYETVVRNVTLASDTGPVNVVLSVGRVSTTLTVTAVAGRATSTRLPVPNDDVPAQVSSVPAELIGQQGTNTIADALRNASGVQAFRWYGVYEQYTIRGFNDPNRDDANVMLVDGLRFGGNRYATQTHNVESVEVLKGPNSILYGRGAVGGSINIVRKKPEPVESYEFGYRGGRFNSHQVDIGATGPLGPTSRLLYRVGASFDRSDGWRDAGADRFNISPSLTWNIEDGTSLTVHQTFNRDRFDGDGGVPLNITGLATYRPDLRFSLPQDNVLVKDSQTQVLFNRTLSPDWEFRNSFLGQATSDRYFVTEGVYGDPDNNQVFREPLDFHHHRAPIQNQADLIGRIDLFGRHNVLVGYEYQNDDYRTDVTAGDDPGCVCGYWWMTISPMDITTLEETTPTLDGDTIARQTFVTDRIHAFYWQDQIDVLPRLKVNVGGRFDDYRRRVDRVFTSDPDNRFELSARDQSAYTYRAGVVYAPRDDQQIYFSTASSFTPVTTVPADGSELEPRTARNYEVGHRWQGLDGRVDTSFAFYYIIRNNLSVRDTGTTFIQVGEQRSKGVDLDVNADLGWRTHLIFNYGFTRPRFEDADDVGLTGLMPRYVPEHTANAWLRKDFESGFNASIGARYVGSQFANDSNTTRLGGYTLLSGAVGYRTERWEWSMNADNLLDREGYFLPGHFSNLVFPGQPISLSSSIRVRY
jgi:iron complex outermembrane receptor protein